MNKFFAYNKIILKRFFVFFQKNRSQQIEGIFDKIVYAINLLWICFICKVLFNR